MEIIQRVLAAVGVMDPPPTPEEQIFTVIRSGDSAAVKRDKLAKLKARMGADAFKNARREIDKDTPLMHAIWKDKTSEVQTLLELGASVNLGTGIAMGDPRGRAGDTYVGVNMDTYNYSDNEILFPLRIAIRRNNLDIVKLLDAHGQKYTKGYESALYDAIKYRRLEILEYLVEKRPDGRDKRFSITTALITALRESISSTYLADMINHLLNLGANPNDQEEEGKYSPLFYAIRTQFQAAVQIFSDAWFIDFTKTYRVDGGQMLNPIEFANYCVQEAERYDFSQPTQQRARDIVGILEENQAAPEEDLEDDDGPIGEADLLPAARMNAAQAEEFVTKLFASLPVSRTVTVSRDAINAISQEDFEDDEEVIVLNEKFTSPNHIFKPRTIKAWFLVRITGHKRMSGVVATEYVQNQDGSIIPGAIQKARVVFADAGNKRGANAPPMADGNRGANTRSAKRLKVLKAAEARSAQGGPSGGGRRTRRWLRTPKKR